MYTIYCQPLKQIAFILFSFVCVCAVFLPEELRLALMPTLENLYRQDPESHPFRQPVDPKLLGCLVSDVPCFAIFGTLLAWILRFT